MLISKARVLVVVAGLPWASTAFGQVTNWTNAAGGNWNNAGNWSAGIPNSPTSDANITLAGNYSVNLDISPTLNSATINNPSLLFTMNGNTVTTGGWSQTGATVNADAGARLNVSGNAGFVQTQTSGLNTSRLQISVGGTLTTQRAMFMWTRIQADGPLDVDPDTGPTDLCDTDVDHNGGLARLRGQLRLSRIASSVSSYTSSAASTFRMENDQSVVTGAGTSTFTNNGLILKNSGVGNSGINVTNFVNNGEVRVQSGTLTITGNNGSVITTGSWRAVSGARLDVFASGGGSISGISANLELSGAGAASNVLDTVTTINAGGAVRFLAGASGTGGATPLSNSGTIQIDGAGSGFTAGGTLTNASGGQIVVSGGATAGTVAGVALVNNGSISISGAGSSLATGSDFSNNAGASVTIGPSTTLTVAPGSALTNYNTGTRTLSGGAFNVRGTLTADNLDIRTLDSTVVLDGATAVIRDQNGLDAVRNLAVISGNGRFTIANGRNFTSAGDLTVQNTGRLTVDAGCTYTIPAGSTLTNLVAGSFSASQFVLRGQLVIPAGSVTDLTGDVELNGPGGLFSGPGGTTDAFTTLETINNNGALTISNNRSLTLGAPTVNVNGTLNVGSQSATGGSVSVTNNLTVAGTLGLQGGTLTVGGEFNMNGTLTGNGSINGNAVNNGVLAPGNSPGEISITGDFTQGAEGAVRIQIESLVAFDRIHITGDAIFGGPGGALAGMMEVEFTPTGGYTPRYLDSYRVMTFGARPNDGRFADMTGLNLGPDAYLLPVWSDTSLTLVYIPAPSVAGLALAIGVFVLRRRR